MSGLIWRWVQKRTFQELVLFSSKYRNVHFRFLTKTLLTAQVVINIVSTTQIVATMSTAYRTSQGYFLYRKKGV